MCYLVEHSITTVKCHIFLPGLTTGFTTFMNLLGPRIGVAVTNGASTHFCWGFWFLFKILVGVLSFCREELAGPGVLKLGFRKTNRRWLPMLELWEAWFSSFTSRKSSSSDIFTNFFVCNSKIWIFFSSPQNFKIWNLELQEFVDRKHTKKFWIWSLLKNFLIGGIWQKLLTLCSCYYFCAHIECMRY